MTTELFSNESTVPELDQSKDYLTELVGEGKKYKDAAALAKAVVAANQHIKNLETETAQMRSALKGEEKIDQLLQRLQTTGSENNEDDQSRQNTLANNEQKPSLSLSDVEKLLQDRDAKRTEEQNLATAVAKAREAFGANYAQVLTAKAAELGLSQDYLVNVAKTAPSAFLKLMEVQPQPNVPGVPRSTVAPNALGTGLSDEKNYKYYENLRKQIGNAQFFSTKIQQQLHKDAQRLGPAFYN